MPIYHIPGFPEEVSEAIEMPNIGALLLMPTFHLASEATFRKYADPFQKHLLSLVPLERKHKYISIVSQVQVLSPDNQSVPNRVMDSDDEWHRDGASNIFDRYDRTHLLLSKCVALTEFNTNPHTLDLPDPTDGGVLCKMLNGNPDYIHPQKMQPGRITTFTNHVHRTTKSPMPEMRFMFRVAESDTRTPAIEEMSVNRPVSVSKRGDGARNSVPNITRTPGKIVIHY